jgi:hypothetical protein
VDILAICLSAPAARESARASAINSGHLRRVIAPTFTSHASIVISGAIRTAFGQTIPIDDCFSIAQMYPLMRNWSISSWLSSPH